MTIFQCAHTVVENTAGGSPAGCDESHQVRVKTELTWFWLNYPKNTCQHAVALKHQNILIKDIASSLGQFWKTNKRHMTSYVATQASSGLSNTPNLHQKKTSRYPEAVSLPQTV